MDTELDRIHLHIDTPCKSAVKKGSLFGSIERGIDRMICMLTPKKKSSFTDEPRKVKVWDIKISSFHLFTHCT